MSSDPPDNEEEVPQVEVQEYLDMLLTQATSRPEAQVTQMPERSPRTVADTGIGIGIGKAAPLTVVAGTSRSVSQSRRRTSQTANAAAKQEAPTQRPFADPVKPLTLKMPLPAVKVEAEVKTSPVEPAPSVPSPPLVEEAPTVEPTPVVEAPLAETPIAKPPPAKTPVIETPGVAPDAAEQPLALDEASTAEQELAPPTTEWLANGRPSWAQERFECLLFSVGGLTLAVPLVELGTIIPIDDGLTTIFGQADWFMGLLQTNTVNLRTVNTAKVVMPERYTDDMKDTFSYVISINGVDWGLAVDTVSNAIALDPEDVRWRSQRGKRPWLAGTVVEHMCALLDVSQLAAMFHQQNQS